MKNGLLYDMIPDQGLRYAVSKTNPYRYHVYMDRCHVTSNEASDIDKYTVSATLQHGSIFEMENCQISDNTMQGGISLRLERVSQTNTPMGHRILNNEFTYNKQGNGIVDVRSQSNTGNPEDTVQIYGNLVMHNSPKDTESTLGVRETYVNVESNIVYNNTGKRAFFVEQRYIPYQSQFCSANVIAYNLGQVINEKYSIEVGATGVHFRNNVIQNPANDYEINALQFGKSDIINATHNWWGITSAQRIGESLRDSEIVIGYPDIIFEPYLYNSQPHVQSSE